MTFLRVIPFKKLIDDVAAIGIPTPLPKQPGGRGAKRSHFLFISNAILVQPGEIAYYSVL